MLQEQQDPHHLRTAYNSEEYLTAKNARRAPRSLYFSLGLMRCARADAVAAAERKVDMLVHAVKFFIVFPVRMR
jgi:hypothetical protein